MNTRNKHGYDGKGRKSFSNLRMTNEVQIHLKIFIIITPFGRNRLTVRTVLVFQCIIELSL